MFKRRAKVVTRGGVAALIGGLIGVMFFLGPTSANADPHAAESIQPVDRACGITTGDPAIGTVTFHRIAHDLIDLNVHLDAALPDTTYYVFLLAPTSRGCNSPVPSHRGPIVPIVTNHEGIVHETATFEVTAQDTEFIAHVANTPDSIPNETREVTVTP
jgi:hypothetical protein